jgi:hypothetical protein
VADIYNAIGDQTATNPTAAFAQMTPLGTTPQTTINDEQGGTQPVVLDTSAINNWGDQAIYVAIRQVMLFSKMMLEPLMTLNPSLMFRLGVVRISVI